LALGGNVKEMVKMRIFSWEEEDIGRGEQLRKGPRSNQGGSYFMGCGVFKQRIARIQERGEVRSVSAAHVVRWVQWLF
jgi:hypothetical protein